MKKYLFFALALLGMASCAKDDLSGGNKPHHNGEVEESYIAINLMAADVDSRAAEDTYGYDQGTADERVVNSAYFFFFDENGNPFNVVGNPEANAPGGGKNHLQLSITQMQEENQDVNVTDISQAVLILNTYKGVYPKQVVAVLNWAPNPNGAYSLDDLHKELAEIGNDSKGYVMSNSVYMNGSNEMVDAVKITEAHIKKEAGLAKANPVDIYVERIAAKVCVTTQGGANSMFKVTDENTVLKPVGGSNKDVYMNVLGWELFNEYATSNLIKNIDISWTPENLGLTWNDSPYYRCYWAASQSTVIDDQFRWMYAKDSDPATTYNGFPSEYGYAVGGHTYCGENTNGETLRTKLILKGQLMEKTGKDTYEELEIASWFGNDYAGEADLKTAVVNSLKYTLLYKVDNDTYSSIDVDDIVCVKGEELQEVNSKIKAYQVGFQLSDVAGKGNDRLWYLYSPDGQHQPLVTIDNLTDATAETNEYLAKNVEPALLYNDGQTYYIVDIEHLGKDEAKPAYYGVVRNHVYQIDINSIKGFGSPIYSGLDFIVDQPEYPIEYEDSYVAARINVLSWNVVKQTVDIVQ